MKKIEIDYDIDFKDLKKINRSKNYFKLIIVDIIIALFLLLALIPPDPVTLTEYFIATLTLLILFSIIFYIIESVRTTVFYKNNDLKCKLIFKENEIEKVAVGEKIVIDYSHLKKIKEELDSFLIYINKDNILKIKKEWLGEKEVEFIKNINTSNKKIISKRLKQLNKESKQYKKIKILMMILFIVTILSLWVSFSVVLLTTKKHGTINNFIDNMWIMYLFLPIPLVSIILGFKYKKLGIKCTKNIVAGFIIAFLLIVYGSFKTMYESSDIVEYFDPKIYEETIQTKIPKNGVFQRIEWKSSYLNNHISNLLEFEQNEELIEFNQSISSNEMWIPYSKLNSSLEIFLVPFNKLDSEECYYLIYIKELEQYNILPEKSGVYNVISMKYELNKGRLQIEEFEYNYKSKN